MRCIYVFGGSKNLKWFNDVHILDTDEWKWELVKVKRTNVKLGNCCRKNQLLYVYMCGILLSTAGPQQISLRSVASVQEFDPFLCVHLVFCRFCEFSFVRKKNSLLYLWMNMPTCFSKGRIFFCLMLITDDNPVCVRPTARRRRERTTVRRCSATNCGSSVECFRSPTRRQTAPATTSTSSAQSRKTGTCPSSWEKSRLLAQGNFLMS